jgi:hypothetical protein
VATLLLSATVVLYARAHQPAYRVTRTYPIGGDGFWDYVVPDPPNHRLFVARQTRVMVVDENDGKLLGESSGHGFATCGNDRSALLVRIC